MIRTPADMLTYLKAVAEAHPLVEMVITGDDLRLAEDMLGKIKYIAVDIETPQHYIPVSEDQSSLMTRLYVYHNTPEQDRAHFDINHDTAHRVAASIVQCIKTHAENSDYGFSLPDGFQIEPRLHVGSDNLVGWMVPIKISVDQDLCSFSDIDADDVIFPKFRWTNSTDSPATANISLANISIAESPSAVAWYWQEKWAQPAIALLEDDSIEVNSVSPAPPYRIIKVWLRITKGGKHYYAYAAIDSRYDSGWSTPYIPQLPAAE